MRRSLFVLLGLSLLVAVPKSSSTAPAPPDDPKIAASVRAGSEYLRQTYANGTQANTGHGAGSATLAGLAMVEGGVKLNDPAVLGIVESIRKTWSEENNTYAISLAILLLDRCADPADVPIVQLLGTRLYAGQTAEGGWSYQCPDLVPMIRLDQSNEMLGTPGGLGQPKGQPDKPKKDDGFPTVGGKPSPFAPAATPGRLPRGIASYNAAVRSRVALQGRQTGGQTGGDNSNTQFGLIALWAASRHGVPADDAFAILEARFLRSQSRADFGWGYTIIEKSTPAMTSAGLLGLAVGAGRGEGGFNASPTAPTSPPPGSTDPFDLPKKAVPNPNGLPGRKPAVDAALKSLGTVLKVTPNAVGLKQFVGHGDEYYMLWSIERVCVAYGLETLGDQNWYAWGSGWLLAQQTSSGSFRGSNYGDDVATAFSVLFLCRSNFVKDLTRRITGQVKDPGQSEMRAGKDFRPPLAAPPTGGSPGLEPGVRPPVDAKTAAAICDGLLKSQDFPTTLTEVQDAKGSEHTVALQMALTKLIGEKKSQAREALAMRLTRMTAKTLRTMLTDKDDELRRAASLACGMKDDRGHLPDLIDRLTDATPMVVQAARASLKAMTDKDFGPAPEADEATCKKAQAEWNKWYLTEGKK